MKTSRCLNLRSSLALIATVILLMGCDALQIGSSPTPARQQYWSLTTPWRLIGGMKVNGSWDQLGFKYNEVRVLEKYKGEVYAGLACPDNMRAEVWKYNGSTWEHVGGGGIKGSWPTGTAHAVDSLASDGTYLYAGTGYHLGKAYVWRYDGTSWEMIGGDGINGGWDSSIDDVWNLAIHQGHLYAGLQGEDDGQRRAPLYRWDGHTWELMTGIHGERGGWDMSEGHTMSYISISDGTYMYTGLAGREPGNGDVWRFDGTSFQQIGGDGINGSWNVPDVQFVEDLIMHNGELYVSLQGATDLTGKRNPPIWRYNGSTWSPVGDFPEEWETASIFNRMISYHGELYATAGGPAGSASLWVLNAMSGKWQKLGGGGLEGSNWHLSWGQEGAQGQWIYTMIEFQDRILLGFAGSPATGEVWGYPY